MLLFCEKYSFLPSSSSSGFFTDLMQEKTNMMICSCLYLSGFSYVSPEIIDTIKRMLLEKGNKKKDRFGMKKISEQLKLPKLKRALLSFPTYLPLASRVS